MSETVTMCCEQFAADVRAEQFERFEDGTWDISGCCGGGCYVVRDMKFCPYCGTKTSRPQGHTMTPLTLEEIDGYELEDDWSDRMRLVFAAARAGIKAQQKDLMPGIDKVEDGGFLKGDTAKLQEWADRKSTPPPQPTETREGLVQKMHTLADQVGVKFVPDPDKVASFPAPAAPSQDELVRRLLARNVFWINGSRWMMGEKPDPDCQEAAARITALEAEVERAYADCAARIKSYHADLFAAHAEKSALRSDLTKARAEIDRLEDCVSDFARALSAMEERT